MIPILPFKLQKIGCKQRIKPLYTTGLYSNFRYAFKLPFRYKKTVHPVVCLFLDRLTKNYLWTFGHVFCKKSD